MWNWIWRGGLLATTCLLALDGQQQTLPYGKPSQITVCEGEGASACVTWKQDGELYSRPGSPLRLNIGALMMGVVQMTVFDPTGKPGMAVYTGKMEGTRLSGTVMRVGAASGKWTGSLPDGYGSTPAPTPKPAAPAAEPPRPAKSEPPPPPPNPTAPKLIRGVNPGDPLPHIQLLEGYYVSVTAPVDKWPAGGAMKVYVKGDSITIVKVTRKPGGGETEEPYFRATYDTNPMVGDILLGAGRGNRDWRPFPFGILAPDRFLFGSNGYATNVWHRLADSAVK